MLCYIYCNIKVLDINTMNRDLSDYRESYEQRKLIKKSLPKNPIQLFANWFDEADNSNFIREANAMT